MIRVRLDTFLILLAFGMMIIALIAVELGGPDIGDPFPEPTPTIERTLDFVTN